MIYDTFLFFNELEMLDIRLHVHDPHVDRFVLVESRHTFSGKPKPLHFYENTHLFSPFLNKMEHIIVDKTPMPDPWENERLQRDAALEGMPFVNPSDVVVVADVDELIDFATFKETDRCSISCKNYYYYLNVRFGWSTGPEVFTWETFEHLGTTLGAMRQKTNQVANGWHFSYIGGPDRISEKIKAFSHQEFNTPDVTATANIAARIRDFKDVLCRPGDHHFEKVPINAENHPKYIVENQEKFSHLIL